MKKLKLIIDLYGKVSRVISIDIPSAVVGVVA